MAITIAGVQGAGKPFNPLQILGRAVGNIMSSVLFGEHFEYKDPKLHDLMSRTSRHHKNVTSLLHMFCNVFPFLLKLPLIPKIAFKETTYLYNFVLECMKEHKRTLKPEAPRDLIDSFLLRIKEVNTLTLIF
ncbi:hypothetical protein AB205_0050810 [Aquarana catesbeiana]|uniref:Uncharacterized protein n=1 Tax=Aquarana catesbeiana TaxID=8400 RepID=A0A2G9RSG6_AQUCT|nr:hypothetical protein AB205_0050810 [Aquarana catesbeiana]